MTNREWMNTLSDDEIAEIIEVTQPYCNKCPDKEVPSKEDKIDTCSKCISNWLKEKHIEVTMPELKNGDFIAVEYKYKYFNCDDVVLKGVIVQRNAEEIFVLYENGGFDTLSAVEDKIVKVYSREALCFRACRERLVIWEKDS